MKRTACSACGYDDLELFLDLGMSPIADAYTSTADELSPTYPLQLAVCTGCWLVQLLEVVDHDVLFGTGYSFYSSASAPLSAYHEAYAADVLNRYRELAKRLTVEIGCNDGDMLRHFEEAGCETVGVDPASGPVQVALNRVHRVVQEPFGRRVAEGIRDAYGPAGLVIANHVLAHVESVSDVLDGVQHLLAEDGVAFIEVQYLPDLLVNNAFDLVYHEHRNFFSLMSLENAIQRWGLHVVDVELTTRQGGSIRVQVSRERPLIRSRIHASVLHSERWLMDICAYHGLQGRVTRIRDRLGYMMQDVASQGPVVGYGAPAKATTLLNYCRVGRDQLDWVIDTTIAKQGRFIPGTGVPIVAPRAAASLHDDTYLDEASTVLLLCWNYATDVIRRHLDWMNDGGRWIIPVPIPVLL